MIACICIDVYRLYEGDTNDKFTVFSGIQNRKIYTKNDFIQKKRG